MVRNMDRGNYRHSPVHREDAYRFEYTKPSYTARATHPEYLLLNPETDTPYFDKRTDREVTRAAHRASQAWNPVAQYMHSKLGRVASLAPAPGVGSRSLTRQGEEPRSRDFLQPAAEASDRKYGALSAMLNARYANLEAGFLPAGNYEIPNAGAFGESAYTVPPMLLESSMRMHDTGSPRRADQHIAKVEESLRGQPSTARSSVASFDQSSMGPASPAPFYSPTPVRSPYAGRGPLSGVN